jgi:DNA-3-methyladenine glycosylase I
MVAYHDLEWGIPVHDEHRLFEMLVLEGAQAGLSWETILRKRDRYRERFFGFDPARVARMTERQIASALQDAGIVRHRGKIEAAVGNARAFRSVQQAFGSFDAYVWEFVDGTPLVNRPATPADVPAQTPLSERLSKDLKKRGFAFVGPTIVYSFMQASGMVNDHLAECGWHDRHAGA